MYDIQFTDDGLRDVKALPKNVRNALGKAMKEQLSADPYSSSAGLRAPLDGWRSFHYGKHRVLFRVYKKEKTVAVAAVGKHDKDEAIDVYKRLEEIAKQGKLAEQVLATLRGLSAPPKR